MFEQTISFPTAFGAGLLSFFSPCILPLLPAYFTFITGISLDELLEKEKDFSLRKKVITSTLMFILGFTIIFVLMGLSASAAGGFIAGYKNYFRIGGGIIVIIFGLHLSGLIQLRFLQFEKRIHLNKKPLHWLGAFFAGNAFAAGWTPCIGPILGTILLIAGGQETMAQGGFLLLVYSLGLAIPFLVLSFFIHLLLGFMKKTGRFLKYMNAVAGILLMGIGVILLTNSFGFITSLLV